MLRKAALCFAAALALVPATARADDKAACFDASEKAQKLKNEKKLGDARTQFIICARESCPSAVRVECAKSLTEVENATSTVVIRVRDADGKDVIDVKVYVDGNLLLPRLQGTAVPVDPGEHKFRYEFPNGTSVEDTVLIAEGEKDRVIRAQQKELTTAGGGGGGGGETTSKGGGIGVGLVALGVFVGLQVDAQGTYSNMKNTCGVTGTCDQGKVNGLGTEFGVSGVMLAVGGVALAAGVVWLVVNVTSGHKAAEKAASVFAPSGLKF